MLASTAEEIACDMLHPNILVQIPTNRHRYNATTNQNININKQQEEIKAEEIIKSELDNVQAVHGQPNYLRRRESISDSSEVSEKDYPLGKDNASLVPVKLVTARPKAAIKCFKCKYCPFISILQSSLDTHEKIHGRRDETDSPNVPSKPNRKKLFCPGCDNIFYSRKPLKAHLLNDHQMSADDISVLLQSCLTNAATRKSPKLFPNGQKIYLKNVEVLKNPVPNPLPSIQDNRNFPSNTFVTNENCMFSNTNSSNQLHDITCIDLDDSSNRDSSSKGSSEERPKDDYFCNKIYVRDINNMNNKESSGQCNFTGVNNYLLGNAIPSPPTTASSILNHSNNITQTISQSALPGFNYSYAANFNESNSEIGPLPESLTTYSIHVADGRQMTGTWQMDLHANCYEHNVCPDSYPNAAYDRGIRLAPSDLNATLPSIRKDHNFDYMRCMSSENSNSNSVISNEIENGYLTTTPSPDVQPIPVIQNERKKIFIKNIDILKKPILTTTGSDVPNNRKSMLHLRTVDEVNLMLINKVQKDNNYYNETSMEQRTDCILINEKKCGDAQSLETDYSEYDINEFVSSLGTESFVMAPPTMNYFNAIPENQINSELIYDTNTDNTIIIVDDQPVDALSDNANFTASVPNNRPLIDDRIINTQANEPDGNYTVAPGTTDIETNDFIIVSSEEIINNCEDILDLTTDEVEQIFDDSNLFNNNFNNFLYPKMKDDKLSDCQDESIEYHQMISENETTAKMEEISMLISDKNSHSSKTPISKRKGRPKGTRKSYYSTSGEKLFTYKCNHSNCSIRFISQNTLAFHETCHTVTTRNGIFCPKCDDNDNIGVEWNWNTLHTHLWREHKIDMELYSCPKCSFKTPILSRLNNTHMKIHSNTKDYECTLCLKAFKNSKQLKNHRRIHTDNSAVHKCNFCNKSFYNIRYLRQHIRKNHEQCETDNFKCEICFKTFASEQLYRNHRLIHFGEKKFQCTTCKYKSNDHNALRRHQMTHNKEAHYKCSACDFQCIQSTSYKGHIMKKHPELAKEFIFSCNTCDFKTVSKKIFKVHLLKHGIE